MAKVLLFGGVICLLACLASAVLHFRGALDVTSYRNAIAIASLGWFILATRYATRRKP